MPARADRRLAHTLSRNAAEATRRTCNTSLRDISRAEYEAVLDRLSRSARMFAGQVGSTNYFTRMLEPLLRDSSRGLDN